jgi:hypothetical protein
MLSSPAILLLFIFCLCKAWRKGKNNEGRKVDRRRKGKEEEEEEKRREG